MIAISRPSGFNVNEGTKRSICQEIVRVPATQIELAVAKWWVELFSGAKARWADPFRDPAHQGRRSRLIVCIATGSPMPNELFTALI
jgi:hypothetical protein